MIRNNKIITGTRTPIARSGIGMRYVQARPNLIDRHYYTTSSAQGTNITLGPLFLGSLPAVTSSVAFWIAFALLTIGPAIAIGTIAAAWAARHPLPGFAIASIALLGAVLGFALGLIVAPFVIVAVLA